jgi:short-subunit dehydrogenase
MTTSESNIEQFDEYGRGLALVTGASTGIGFELAKVFGENGYDLVLVAENREKLNHAARELSALNNPPVTYAVVADLSTSSGVESLYEYVQELERPVDLLAANAGVGVYGDFARETELEDELAMIHLNVTSQVHLTKLIVRDMVRRGAGDILITSSIAATMPGPRASVYAATKSFLRSFGEGIREELADTGVNVTVLMPGATETDFFERADMEDTKVGQMKKDDPAMVARAAFDALRSGDDKVVTGFKNKFQAAMARLMTDPMRARAHGSQMKPNH